MKITPRMLDELTGREGKYSNHPSDRGGETMWGVTVAVARAFGYTGPMHLMPIEEARRIYTARFWDQPRFCDVADINLALAEELFDTGVNMGTTTAGRFLQRALNTLNKEGKAWPDVLVDGAVGAMTLAALRAFLAQRGVPAGVSVLLRMLNAQQCVRYMEISEANGSQEDFVFGWVSNRVGALA